MTATTSTDGTFERAQSAGRRATDFALVITAWVVAVSAATVLPFDDTRVARVALFVHLISLAVGFGGVIMMDVYGLMWLLGRRTGGEVGALAAAAHTVIYFGVGGLLASGIALHPDVASPLTRLKLALVLVLMLNGTAAQRMIHGLQRTLAPGVSGASIPWHAFQRVLFAALVSQATWWGAIAIGFVTNGQRHP